MCEVTSILFYRCLRDKETPFQNVLADPFHQKRTKNDLIRKNLDLTDTLAYNLVTVELHVIKFPKYGFHNIPEFVANRSFKTLMT